MMITYKEFAKRRNKRPSEVIRLIETGRIAGAAQDNQAIWMIPEGALIDYKPRQKKAPTVSDHVFNILKALNGGYNVNASILRIPPPKLYESTVTSMIDGGLLRQDQKPTAHDSGLSLTIAGIEMAQKGKKDYSKLYQATLASIVEGVARSLK